VKRWQGDAPTAEKVLKRKRWAATEQDDLSPIYRALCRERHYNPLAQR
jgi:hypothetical protein